MRPHKLIFVGSIILSLTLALSGCGDDSTEGEETTDGDRPDGSHDIIPDDQLELIEDAGASIYLGTDTPEFDGTYLMDSLVTTFKSHGEIDPDYTISDYYYTFEFIGGEEFDYEVELEAPSEDHLVEGIGGYISGSNDCFTIYGRTTEEPADNCVQTNVELFSGCVTDGGIEDFENAWMVQELDGDCDDADRTIQGFTIIEDSFGQKVTNW